MNKTHMHSRAFLAFAHIEKTAGTTFIHALRRNFFMRYLDVRPFSPASHGVFTARDLELSLGVNPWLCAIGGHSVRPIGDLCETFQNLRFVTIFRDPVRRYVSQYLYGNTVLKLDVSFDRFLADTGSHNFQTRKIAGSADLNRAKQILRERFVAIGLVERFDDFLATFAAALRPARFACSYEPRNVGSYSQEEKRLIERYASEIRDVNHVDLELYRYVQYNLDSSTHRLTEGCGPAQMLGIQERLKHLADGAMRKLYYEPVTGFMRRANGLPMKGSY